MGPLMKVFQLYSGFLLIYYILHNTYNKHTHSHTHTQSHTQGFTHLNTREEGNIILYIIQVPKVFKQVFLFTGLKTLDTFIKPWMVGVQTFQSMILIYKTGNVIYHNWGCKSIYRLLLSYPLWSLRNTKVTWFPLLHNKCALIKKLF